MTEDDIKVLFLQVLDKMDYEDHLALDVLIKVNKTHPHLLDEFYLSLTGLSFIHLIIKREDDVFVDMIFEKGVLENLPEIAFRFNKSFHSRNPKSPDRLYLTESNLLLILEVLKSYDEKEIRGYSW